MNKRSIIQKSNNSSLKENNFQKMIFPITSFLDDKNIFLREEEEEIEFQLNCKPSNNLNYVIHRAYITQRNNERQGNANTLTRAEVRGGGRKPWRQKGTGRARAGSNRSPLWQGGGVSFGPKSKHYFNKINRKEWRLALRALLIKKAKSIIIIKDLEKLCQENKTKIFKSSFESLGITFQEKVLFIIACDNNAIRKVTQNIKTVTVLPVSRLNIKDVLYARKLVFTRESLHLIEKIYNE